MNLGTSIRSARTALGMTQETLAEALGVVPQTVSKWERNESQPDAALLPKLADALNLSLDRLFGRKPGTWEDAREALLRWLPRRDGVSRREEIMSLMVFAFQYLMGRWDEDNTGPDPFDFGPNYPASGWDYHLLGDEVLALLGTKEILPFGFFAVEGPAGWGPLFADPDLLAPVFDALGDRETRRAILRIQSAAHYTTFLREDAAEVLGVEDPEAVIPRLQKLRLLLAEETKVDGQETEFLHFQADPHMLAILLLARAVYGPEWPSAGFSGMGTQRIGTPPLRTKEPEEAAENE